MSAAVEPFAMPMASSAASGCSSASRSGRTSQSAPAMPITPAYRRPVTGCASCAQTDAHTISNAPQTALRIDSELQFDLDQLLCDCDVLRSLDREPDRRPLGVPLRALHHCRQPALLGRGDRAVPERE